MSETVKQVTACVLIIGNEILSGRTKDANLPFLAEELNKLGIQLREGRVLPDIEDEIIKAVNEARAKFDYVFTTGGIGPTHDDITSYCVGKAFDRELERNAEAVELLVSHYANRSDLNESRLKMAEVPVGAELVHNPVSKAPGFRLENVYVMAGIPRIMQAQFDGIKHQLVGGSEMLSVQVTAFLGEGTIAKDLTELQNQHPETEIGSYPFAKDGRYGTSLVARGFDQAELNQIAEAFHTLFRAHGVEPEPEV